MENEHASAMELADLKLSIVLLKNIMIMMKPLQKKHVITWVKLQNGDAYCRTMWKKLVDITMHKINVIMIV